MNDFVKTTALLRPDDTIDRQNAKLQRMVEVLMDRVESKADERFNSYSCFQKAVSLDAQVRERTSDLEQALAQLTRSKSELLDARQEAEIARKDLAGALEVVKEGFALFHSDGLLNLSNTRFAKMFPDVVMQIKPGLHFKQYIRAISQSAYLVPPNGLTRDQWLENRIKKSRRVHSSFTIQLTDDRWLQISEQRTPNGGTAILQTEITDIVQQERRKRDNMLDSQERVMRSILDHINQGVCIFDNENCLTGWNDRFIELTGFQRELVRQGISFFRLTELFASANTLGLTKKMETLVEWVHSRRENTSMSMELHLYDGTYLDLFCKTTSEHGFLISFTDVSAERAATKALHESNETLEQRVHDRTAALQEAHDQAEYANASKSRFLAAVSHDLLQPINAAKLFIETLEETDLKPSQKDISSRIKRAFISTETILGALLDISKLDAGAVAEVTTFPLSRLLEPIKEEFQAIARAKGIELNVVLCSLDVESDPSYLRRILQNLVSNAVRFTHTGKVLVGVRRKGDFISIDVIDTGLGIPDDQKQTIFHEFHRISHPTDTSTGMGLGLAIVQRSCSLLDHKLSLQSTLGKGTRFSVLVPCRPLSDPSLPAMRAKPMVQRTLTNMIPLVLQNDPVGRLALMMLLDNWGASPIEADSLESAILMIDEIGITPDVILVDFHIAEDRNGLQKIRSLRERFGQIPAVLITADRTENLRQTAMEANVTVLNKPLNTRKLRRYLTS